jgi:NADPH-dependent ferric siderophore reductase
MRTYTPRRYDPGANTLEVQFGLHGEGPASRWAEQSRPGDLAAIGGPGGRFALDPDVSRWWIGGDESALPAIATFLEALPRSATAHVHLEVDGPEDHIGLPDHPGAEHIWHERSGYGDNRWGAQLLEAARHAEIYPATHVWVACEASAVRRIRSHLLTDRFLSRDQVTTRGYWRLGEANHPDHDYGED